MTSVIAIFGAAVLPDGRPSPSLRRRIEGGLAAARAAPDAPVFCSGAAGRPGQPTEAAVMRDALLAAGVAAERLVLDEASRDTLQSVTAACRFIASRGLGGCIVCSDTYHVPRIRLLFAELGVRSTAGPVGSGWREAGVLHWLKMSLREVLAIPYDGLIVLVMGKRLLAEAS